MAEYTEKEPADCETSCQAEYFDCIARTPTGCVEVLRVCREKCAGTTPAPGR